MKKKREFLTGQIFSRSERESQETGRNEAGQLVGQGVQKKLTVIIWGRGKYENKKVG